MFFPETIGRLYPPSGTKVPRPTCPFCAGDIRAEFHFGTHTPLIVCTDCGKEWKNEEETC